MRAKFSLSPAPGGNTTGLQRTLWAHVPYTGAGVSFGATGQYRQALVGGADFGGHILPFCRKLVRFFEGFRRRHARILEGYGVWQKDGTNNIFVKPEIVVSHIFAEHRKGRIRLNFRQK